MTNEIVKFASALKDHLHKRRSKFVQTVQVEDNWVCPTCGFGGDEVDVVDMEKLDKEIDRFAKSFQKANAEGRDA